MEAQEAQEANRVLEAHPATMAAGQSHAATVNLNRRMPESCHDSVRPGNGAGSPIAEGELGTAVDRGTSARARVRRDGSRACVVA